MVMTLGFSGWAQADAVLVQVEGGTGPGAAAASFSSDAGRSPSRGLDFIPANTPYYLESGKVSHVPEPEGWAMMLMGAGFVFYQVRRRKNKRRPWDLR